jgi:hypothetical protein
LCISLNVVVPAPVCARFSRSMLQPFSMASQWHRPKLHLLYRPQSQECVCKGCQELHRDDMELHNGSLGESVLSIEWPP